jgi:hypothetical protein
LTFVSYQIVISPPHHAAEINFLVSVVIRFGKEILIMIDESHSTFVASEVDSIETPAVPCVEIVCRFLFGDVWFFILFDP